MKQEPKQDLPLHKKIILWMSMLVMILLTIVGAFVMLVNT